MPGDRTFSGPRGYYLRADPRDADIEEPERNAMEEQTALAALRRGDIEGLAEIVRRYQLRAIRAAYLVTRDRTLAEDVAQAAFLGLPRRIAGYDPDRPFGPWFMRGVVRDATKAAARQARDLPLDALTGPATGAGGREPADGGAGPEATWELAETRAEVWQALGALTPAQREAIVLRYYLGLSEAEMASGLGCPPGTVKSRLHAARARLQTLLRPALRHQNPTTGGTRR
jgi:RNA polymerase sigma-70 factor, ECF subfamily